MTNWISAYLDYAADENDRRQVETMSRTVYPSAWGDALPFLPDDNYFRRTCRNFVKAGFAAIRKRGVA